MANCHSDGIAGRIKECLTADEVVRHYGFEPGRGGYIPCPFHNEKTGSLKVYPGAKGWHCFGCGKGGTVIDFVMHLFDLTFPQATLRLNEDFRLGLTAERPTRAEVSARLREREEKARELAEYRRVYGAMNTRYLRLWEAHKWKAPQDQAAQIDDEYAEACRLLPYLNHWFEENPWR